MLLIMAAGFSGLFMIVWTVVNLIGWAIFKDERKDLQVVFSAISAGLLSAGVWAFSVHMF